MTPWLQPPYRQRGVVLLLLAALLFLVGAGVYITVMNNNVVTQRRGTDTVAALRAAREALIAFATLHGDYYGATGAGPGHLVCPDTNGNDAQNIPCGVGAFGRLPVSVTLPSTAVFPLSNYNHDADQQFWYSLSDAFRYSPASVLNSSSAATLSVDGQGGFAAVIIAPGEAVASQNRPSNNASNYLEAGNVGGPAFVNSNPPDPDNFNDIVFGISMAELMPMVTARVAESVRTQLNAYHGINGFYPIDQAEFASAMTTAPAWYAANQWGTVANYVRLSPDSATVLFTGCNITYTFAITAPSASRPTSQC